jgi:hypothetical protein
MKRKAPLGQVLVQLGYLDEDRLHAALAHHRQWGMPLAQAVVEKKFCTLKQVMDALAWQAGLPTVDLDKERMDPFLSKLVPRRIADRYRAVPLRVEGARAEVLVIAIAAPASIEALDSIQAVAAKSRLIPHLASDAAVARAIRRLYEGATDAEVAPPAEISQTGMIHDMRLVDFAGNKPAPAAGRPAAPAPEPTPYERMFEVGGSGDPWTGGDGWAGLALTANTKAMIDKAAKARGESRKASVAAILEAYVRSKIASPD